MKIRFLKLKILLVFLLLFFVFHTRERVIYIYYDKASSPTLVQMTDFVKQKNADLRVAYWERVFSHITNKDKHKNALFLGNDAGILSVIDVMKLHYKRVKVILHINMHQDYFFRKLVDSYGENIIKELHLYEDAASYVWDNSSRDWIFYQYKDIKKYLYMWGDMKKMCPDKDPLRRCAAIKNIQDQAEIREINFTKLSKQLSLDEKRQLFDLTGFDYERYKELFFDKKTVLYTLGINIYAPYKELQIVALKKWCMHPIYKNYKWFYKNHPNGYAIPSDRVLKYLCPNIQSIDAYMPYELLILAGLKPTKIAGSGSSVFFHQTPETVLTYIERDGRDTYLQTLKKAGIITDKNLFTIKDALKESYNINLFKVVGKDLYLFFIKGKDNVVYDIFSDRVGNVTENEINEWILTFGNQKYTLRYEKDNIWRIVE